jgi:hypothetical protein
MTLFLAIYKNEDFRKKSDTRICDLKGLREFIKRYTDFDEHDDDECEHSNVIECPICSINVSMEDVGYTVCIVELNKNMASHKLTARQIWKIISNPLPEIAVAHTFPKTKGSGAPIKDIPLHVLRKLNEFL